MPSCDHFVALLATLWPNGVVLCHFLSEKMAVPNADFEVPFK
jgi:hypothetical protein